MPTGKNLNGRGPSIRGTTARDRPLVRVTNRWSQIRGARAGAIHGARMTKLALLALAACTASAPTAPASPPPALPFAVKVSGHGPPMILIPGLVSSGDVWTTTVEHVQSHYTCHVLTLPGFAGQPPIAAPMLPTVREAIATYIAREKLDHPVIVGHSLGGFVALDLAATHPDAVGPLFIVDSLPWLPGGNDPTATPESMRPIADAMRTKLPDAPKDAYETQQRAILETMITAPADREVAFDWAIRSDRKSAGEALYEILTTDLRPELAAIRSPAIVIATWKGWPGWSHDKAQSVYTEQYAKLAGTRVVVTDTARHFVMLDDPQFLFAQLDAFLARPRP